MILEKTCDLDKKDNASLPLQHMRYVCKNCPEKYFSSMKHGCNLLSDKIYYCTHQEKNSPTWNEKKKEIKTSFDVVHGMHIVQRGMT